MKHLLLALLLLPVFAPVSYAQEPAVAPAVTEAAAAPVVAPAADTAPVKVTVDGDKVTVGDVVVSAGDVLVAVKNYRAQGGADASSKAARRLAFMLLLAAIFKFALSGLKLSTPFWKGAKGKALLKVITITLGLGVGLISQLALGDTWYDAITVGLSGPLAVAFHEYTYLIPVLARKRAAAAAKK